MPYLFLTRRRAPHPTFSIEHFEAANFFIFWVVIVHPLVPFAKTLL